MACLSVVSSKTKQRNVVKSVGAHVLTVLPLCCHFLVHEVLHRFQTHILDMCSLPKLDHTVCVSHVTMQPIIISHLHHR